MSRKTSPTSLFATDSDNATEFARVYRCRFAFSTSLGWLRYDHIRWVVDEDEQVFAAGIEFARQLMAEAEAFKGAERDERVRRARQAASRRGIENMLRLAEHQLALLSIDLDRGRMRLNVRNGLLDLKTGRLLKHRPEDWMTKLAPVAYHPKAKCPEFERLLKHITGGDREYEAFLQRMCGYMLTGETSEDKVFVLLGPGGTGKSTFLRLVGAVLGDYAKSIEFAALAPRRFSGGGPRPELDRCKQARLVMAIEASEEGRIDAALIKSLSGGDRLTTHPKYGDPKEWDPWFKLCLAVNELPAISKRDTGSSRRLLVLPFEHVVQDDHMDRGLRDRLAKTEKSRAAFFAWAVRGCKKWRKEGVGSCEVVERATRTYWDGAAAAHREVDILERFLVQECAIEPGSVEPSSDLYDALLRFAQREEVKAPSAKRLAVVLRARGCKKADKATVRRWTGVRLLVRPTSPGVTDDTMTVHSEEVV